MNAETLRGYALAREGFDVSGAAAHVVPLVVGDAERASRMVENALDQGVFAEAVRPPAVPDGTARVRLSVMATHSREELRQAATVLARAALRAGFRPGAGPPRRRRPSRPTDSSQARGGGGGRGSLRDRAAWGDSGGRGEGGGGGGGGGRGAGGPSREGTWSGMEGGGGAGPRVHRLREILDTGPN